MPPGVLIVTVPRMVSVREDEETRRTSFGPVKHIRIWAPGHETLTWREVWEAFTRLYPGKWAVQMFPPSDQLVDGKAVYHLFVLETEPEGLNIKPPARGN